MSRDPALPYGPAPPYGPPGVPPGDRPQVPAFPWQPFQGYPQYNVSPAQYQGGPIPYQAGWEAPKASQYQQPSSNPMFLVGGQRGGVSGVEACLGACWTALCCCCLWDMFT